jgi:hypothetical protein
MKLPTTLLLALGLLAAGVVQGTPPVDDRATQLRCLEPTETGAVLCYAPDPASAGGAGTSSSVHQFYSQPGSKCEGRPTPLVVCASGSGSMAFSSGCPGTPGANQICLQVSGSASGSAVGRTGRVDAGLSHMTNEDCQWTTLAGGSCSVTFRDPNTGATIHKHWHDMVNSWQCHTGGSQTTGYLSSIPDVVVVSFSVCYKYGPL